MSDSRTPWQRIILLTTLAVTGAYAILATVAASDGVRWIAVACAFVLLRIWYQMIDRLSPGCRIRAKKADKLVARALSDYNKAIHEQRQQKKDGETEPAINVTFADGRQEKITLKQPRGHAKGRVTKKIPRVTRPKFPQDKERDEIEMNDIERPKLPPDYIQRIGKQKDCQFRKLYQGDRDATSSEQETATTSE